MPYIERTDEEIITVYEKHFEKLRENIKDLDITYVNGQYCSPRQILNALKQKTLLGINFLKIFRETYKEVDLDPCDPSLQK